MVPAGYLFVILSGILVILVSKALDALYARMIPVRSIYLFVRAPGIVVHECSHILGCLLTGSQVKKVVFFSGEGGSVTYSPSKVPFLGDLVVNAAPLFVIPLVLYGSTWIFSMYLGCIIPDLSLRIDSPETVVHAAGQIAGMFAENLVYRFNPWFLLFCFLTVSLVLSLAPSRQDMQNAVAGFFLVVLAGALVLWSGYAPAIAVLDAVVSAVGIGLGLGLGFGAIALVLSLPLFVLYAQRSG